MKLNVLERLILLSILPKEGNFTTLKIIRKLRETLSFSEEEHKALKFKEEDGRLFWDSSYEALKDIHVGEKAEDVIVSTLKKMDEEKKLTDEHFSVYEKFIDKRKD